MPLPHPHGNSAGQIANGAFYLETDTPGSTGGRFIGFGEEGTTLIANRPHWALSENINYLYEKISKDLAIPTMDAWTPAGGSGVYYTFTAVDGDVWCGDASYEPPSQVKMDMLFSVLDSSFNQLIDPVTQNKVAVKEVKKGLVDQYGEGFVSEPSIWFQLVNPITLAPVSDYTIPDGTAVFIVNSRKTTLDDLPVDAFSKIPVRVAEEAPAGVVLQNGTRKMTGDLDLNGNDVIGAAVVGSTGTTQFKGDTLTQIRGADIDFQDSHLTSPVYLSKAGTVALQGSYPDNLIETINSRYNIDLVNQGNRVRERMSTITFNDGAHSISWGNMDVILNGDAARIYAGSLVITMDAWRVLVAQASGVVTEKERSSVLPTDLVLAYYYYNSVTVEFSTKIDTRWLLNKRTSTLPITVGALTSVGCDFTSLQDALNFCLAMRSIAIYGGKSNLSFDINIVSDISITAPVTVECGNVTIRGIGDVTITSIHSTNKHIIDAGGNSKIKICDLTIKPGSSAVLDDAHGVIANLGNDSVVDNITVLAYVTGTDCYTTFLYWATGTVRKRVRVSNCDAIVGKWFVKANAAGPATPVLDNSFFFNCSVVNDTTTISSEYAFDLQGKNNVVQHCTIKNGLTHGFANGIRLGIGGRALHNSVTLEGTTGRAINFKPYDTLDMNDVIIQGNFTTGGLVGIGTEISVSKVFNVSIKDNTINACITGILASGCRASIKGNYILEYGVGSTSWASALDVNAFNKTYDHVELTLDSGTFYSNDVGKYIKVSGATNAGNDGTFLIVKWISATTIAYINTAGVTEASSPATCSLSTEGESPSGICVESAISGMEIVGNTIDATDTVSAYASMIYVFDTECIIEGNTLKGQDIAARAIVLIGNGYDTIVSNNRISGVVLAGIEALADTTALGLAIKGNSIYSPSSVAGSSIILSGAGNVVISSNMFNGVEGSAWGSGICLKYVSTLTYKYCQNVSIMGNTFDGVSSTGPQDGHGAVIYCAGSGADGRNISVSGNVFNRCGATSSGGPVTASIIEINGEGCAITGNTIHDPDGCDNTASNDFAVIRLNGSRAAVFGNYIYISLDRITAPTVSAIFAAAANCAISGNVLESLITTYTFRDIDIVRVAANNTTVSGNRINNENGYSAGSWAAVSLTGDGNVCGNNTVYGIISSVGNICSISGNSGGSLAITGDRCTVVGNACYHTVSIWGKKGSILANTVEGTMTVNSSATSGYQMVIGNICSGAGEYHIGTTYPDDTNIDAGNEESIGL